MQPVPTRTLLTRTLFALAMLVGLAVPATGAAQPGVSPMCASALQGRIAWDYQNNTTWAPENIVRLCGRARTDQPAQCFNQVMHGHVNFGGGTRWEWANAINLCQGTRNAQATIGCFQTYVQAGRPWQDAIAACGRAQGGPPPAWAPPPPVMQPPPPPPPQVGMPVQPGMQPGFPPGGDRMMQCRMALQGRVPWNYQGNTTWAEENIVRLCRGGAGDQPAQCFNQVMHGHVNFGAGTRWEWENAVNLCHGSRNAQVTVACFQSQVGSGRPWQQAIANCSR